MKKKSQETAAKRKSARLSRRAFLRISGGSGAALAAIAAGQSMSAVAQNRVPATPADSSRTSARKEAALKIRHDAAEASFVDVPQTAVNNGDESRYPDLRGSFCKTLPINDLGEANPTAYADYVSILMSGNPARFEQLPRDTQAQSKLSNPLSAYAFELVGLDAQFVPLPPAPAFASAETAFEMAELYWQALTVDISHRQYESNPLIQAAVSDLNACSAKTGPMLSGKITPQTLFRGSTPGDLAGPYISQFLWMDIQYGPKLIDQRYRLPRSGQAFMTKRDEWLACQRGMRSGRQVFEDTSRYIANNRDLSEWVHTDFSYQACLNAALIIQRWGEATQFVTNPYRTSKTQSGGVTLGRDAMSFLAHVTSPAQKACWFQKWVVHRRIRPEGFAGMVDNHLSGRKSYDIHADLLRCDGLSRSFAAYGTRLLPAAYPEGSPIHPSYPAGHATNAGAGATMLKAFFNEDMPIPNPVQANADGSALEPYVGPPLTLGNEVNKLAHNVSLGRDAGAVHYRSDGIQGMRLGEAVAISVLKDYSLTYREQFEGFVLTRFDGRKIRIVNGQVLSSS